MGILYRKFPPDFSGFLMRHFEIIRERREIPRTKGSCLISLVHDRYKDLGRLELRPVYVRNEKSTRAHVSVVMLACLVRRELERAWPSADLSVEEALDALDMKMPAALPAKDLVADMRRKPPSQRKNN